MAVFISITATYDLEPLGASGSTQQGSENGFALPTFQQGPGKGDSREHSIMSPKTGEKE